MKKKDDELAVELQRLSLTKRCLILLDDVWEEKVWDDLRMCCRDSQNGSRIVLTTRLSDVANNAQCESKPHHLRLFKDDESWELLEKEVFQGESCPSDFVDVGYQIAKSCRGLPLFIVLVAGVLKEKKKQPELWEKIEESLVSQNIDCLEESKSIVGFSYENLPRHLKPCFLYFGGFLKGKDIQVSKLTRLWQAEWFLHANEEKGLAEAFLEDLIGRNLVMITKKRANGKVKTCRVHDLLHAFCLEKAKEENFLVQTIRFKEEDTLPVEPKEYRLFVHSYQDMIGPWQPSCSNVRSLLLNLHARDTVPWRHDLSFIFNSFKLIKVLDLEAINTGLTFPDELQSLVHMRYFVVQTDANSIPPSIDKLCNLETFVVKGSGGEIRLPYSILKMVKLRHIVVKPRASFSLHKNMDESRLENLDTFSTPHLSYGKDTEMILGKMPNLRKLSCIFSGRKEKTSVLFPRLEFLSRLESLRLVFMSSPSILPHDFSFPLKLKELTLSEFHLPWTQISTIAGLPNLQILKLLPGAFQGDEWKVKDSEFLALKYLKLDNLNIVQWSVTKDAFPKLERLVLTNCKSLEEIPSHFEDAVSLRSIEVNWCSWSVANSAKEIQTRQHEDYCNDAFIVTIRPPDWARRSSPLL